MNIKNLLFVMGLCAVASFAEPSDTTSKQVSETEINVKQQESKKEEKGIKKSLIVNKSPTTWTKIKDLFM